jgi:hypothetical protein
MTFRQGAMALVLAGLLAAAWRAERAARRGRRLPGG